MLHLTSGGHSLHGLVTFRLIVRFGLLLGTFPPICLGTLRPMARHVSAYGVKKFLYLTSLYSTDEIEESSPSRKLEPGVVQPPAPMAVAEHPSDAKRLAVAKDAGF